LLDVRRDVSDDLAFRDRVAAIDLDVGDDARDGLPTFTWSDASMTQSKVRARLASLGRKQARSDGYERRTARVRPVAKSES